MPDAHVGGEWRWGGEWGVGSGEWGLGVGEWGLVKAGVTARTLGSRWSDPHPNPSPGGRGAFRALAIPGVHWMLTSRTFQ